MAGKKTDADKQMTDQHPITPPPKLLEQWETETAHTTKDETWHVAVQAARWGADQELEACCEWLCTVNRWKTVADGLRSVRRPKSQSLKEQALEAFEKCWNDGYLKANQADVIRRALEALPDSQ